MASNHLLPPTFTFTFPPSISPYNVPMKEYIDAHPEYDAIASGAIVFNPQDRVLLLQRASHDSHPNCWEVPGGAVDHEDETMLHGVARELWEEAGLMVKSIGEEVGMGEGAPSLDGKMSGAHVFFTRRGSRIRKLTFLVEVEAGEVRLDANEHQSFVWATEEECRARTVEGVGKVLFTSKAQEGSILEGFRLRQEGKVEES